MNIKNIIGWSLISYPWYILISNIFMLTKNHSYFHKGYWTVRMSYTKGKYLMDNGYASDDSSSGYDGEYYYNKQACVRLPDCFNTNR